MSRPIDPTAAPPCAAAPPATLRTAAPSFAPGAAALGDDEVHVWQVFGDDRLAPELLARYAALLVDDEPERHDRYRVEHARRQFLVARALVRTTLSQYATVDPLDWRFRAGEYGRPEIVSPALGRALRFNLSHTTGLVACAVCWDHDLGLDVEYLNRRTGDTALARRYFAATEVDDLLALPTGRQRDAFFDYWTLKESYIKARGMGLAIPLGHFAFCLSPPAPPRITFAPQLADEPARWQFFQASPTPEHRLALAVGGAEPVRVRYFSVVPLSAAPE